jgi:23S rRNA (uracil1939-C5)-methyltransferase
MSRIFRKSPQKSGGAQGSPRDCFIKETCASCRYINTVYDASLKEKWGAGIATLGNTVNLSNTKIIAPQSSPKLLGYRTHAKLAVRMASQCVNPKPDQRFAIGLFQPGSHQLVDISSCPLHRGNINKLVKDIKAELEQMTLEAYDEETNKGDLRYIAIRSSHITDAVMLTFVMTSENRRAELRDLVNRLRQRGHTIQSSHFNINSDITNVIFGTTTKRLAGADRLRERICNLDFEIGPTSFFQINPWQAETIYRRVEHLAGDPAGEMVAWDLYCGIGQMSTILSQLGYRTLGIEVNAGATRDAANNAARNLSANLPQFITGRVEDVIDELPTWAKHPRLIVVNPSRKGLDPAVSQVIRDNLKASPGSRLLYVSCEMETLARDVAAITQDDLKLRQIEGFDMFPYTEKMEWLAVIS